MTVENESRPAVNGAAKNAFGDAEGDFTIPVCVRTTDEVVVEVAHEVARCYPDSSLEDQARLCVYRSEAAVKALNEQRKDRGLVRVARPTSLLPAQAAVLALAKHEVRVVVPSDTSGVSGVGLLAVYQESGEKAGTYEVLGDEGVGSLALSLKPTADGNWTKEFDRQLRIRAEEVAETAEAGMIPMANCWYDYHSRERFPFSPDRVTLAKFATNLPEEPPRVPEIVQADGSPWNAEQWFQETYEGIDTLLLQVLGMCLRPGHDWRKMVYLTGTGLNGKGTFLQLIRQVVGASLTCAIPPSKFGDQFALSGAIGRRVDLVDEDDVGTFIKDAARLKQVISRDPVTIDRKHRDPMAVQLRMAIIVSLNEVSQKFKDKSQALRDRLVFVPFTARFAGAKKNPAIKDDYLCRAEVREWFAWQALVGLKPYESLDESSTAVVEANHEALVSSDPVMEFVDEFFDKFDEMVFLPFGFLYEVFKHWRRESNPAGSVEAQRVFTQRLKEYLPDGWLVPAGNGGKDQELSTSMWFVGHSEYRAENYPPESALRGWFEQLSGRHSPRVARKARGLVKSSMWTSVQKSGKTPREVLDELNYAKIQDELVERGIVFPAKSPDEEDSTERNPFDIDGGIAFPAESPDEDSGSTERSAFDIDSGIAFP